MDQAKLRRLASLVKIIDPRIGLAQDGLVSVKILEWIEGRSVELLEKIADEETTPVQRHDLEVRLHETLDILMDVQHEKPWK